MLYGWISFICGFVNYLSKYWAYCVHLGGQKLFNEEVSITNKQLDDGLEDLLPQSYKKHNIIFLSGDYVGPVVTPPQHDNLSINWCLDDKDIEVLNSSKGFIIDG